MSATITVGTTAIMIIAPNPKRTAWTVNMLPTGIESGNTGRVHIGKGFPPVSTLGEPNSGQALQQGDRAGENKRFLGDPSPFKGYIWAVASAANQRITLDEDIEQEL